MGTSKSKAKKRRSQATGGSNKAKIPSHFRNVKQFHRPLQFGTAEIKAAWDPKASHRDNLAKMGLEADPNRGSCGKHIGATVSTRGIAHLDASKTGAQEAAAVVFQAIPPSDPIAIARGDLGDRNHRRKPMTDSVQKYVAALIARHGEDYKAMERDIALNVQQHGATKLRGLCARFLLLDDEQRCGGLSMPPAAGAK